MRVNWADPAVQHQYEDMVAVLLQLLHPDALHIEGAGGDEGRDVVRHTDSGLVIYECKRFTDRLTDTRKAQIRRSLKTAASHDPLEWHLVVPINPTPGDEKFFARLQKQYRFPIFWEGRTWLDAQMSRHPAVYRYFIQEAKEEVLELLKDLPIAVDMMESADDALSRLERLHHRLNELDIHYEYSLSTGLASQEPPSDRTVLSVHRGDIRIDIVPRYRGALIARPISGAFTVSFETEDAHLREAFTAALDFGDAVELPPHTVQDWSIDAPGGLGADFTGGSLRMEGLTHARSEPLPVEARVLTPDGNLVQGIELTMTRHRQGNKGGTLYGGDSSNQLQLALRYNVDAGTATLDFAYRPVPLPPAAIRPVATFLAAFKVGYLVELAIGSPPISAMVATLGPDQRVVPAWFADVASAFEDVQQRVRTTFDVPADLTEREAHEVLELAEELSPAGRRFTWKDATMTIRHAPQDSGLEQLLSASGSVLMIERDLSWEFRTRTYDLGIQRVIFEHAVVDDPECVRSHLSSVGESSVRLLPGRTPYAVARLLDSDDSTLIPDALDTLEAD